MVVSGISPQDVIVPTRRPPQRIIDECLVPAPGQPHYEPPSADERDLPAIDNGNEVPITLPLFSQRYSHTPQTTNDAGYASRAHTLAAGWRVLKAARQRGTLSPAELTMLMDTGVAIPAKSTGTSRIQATLWREDGTQLPLVEGQPTAPPTAPQREPEREGIHYDEVRSDLLDCPPTLPITTPQSDPETVPLRYPVPEVPHDIREKIRAYRCGVPVVDVAAIVAAIPEPGVVTAARAYPPETVHRWFVGGYSTNDNNIPRLSRCWRLRAATPEEIRTFEGGIVRG